MTVPTSTYRVQFRNGMTFDRMTALAPYLKRLGVSHLYASPIFTATTGSTHGYDVTDANAIDPAIGGRDGFDRMVRALKAEGLGLILDIVPNHMAASLENPWWRDVIEHGEESAYARHFDIDWSRRLTLPFLDDSFEQVLERSEIGAERDRETGKPGFVYSGIFFPLTPSSYPDDPNRLERADPALIAELHDRQPYQLIAWRDAPRMLSYRRFFEITGLVGVRAEDQVVFDDTHRLILELVRSGAVDGLRIDHVDGLADPKGYLDRLRAEVGPDCYLTVEKILAEDEDLPADWPVSGTTGYEFIATLSHGLADGGKLGALRQAYEAFTGETGDPDTEVRAAKRLLLENNFAGEYAALVRRAVKICRAEGIEAGDLENTARDVIRELLLSFPVYRTYGTASGLPPQDERLLDGVFAKVRQENVSLDEDVLAVIGHALHGSVGPGTKEDASLFRTRFQQLSGPLTAKSVEDTFFFRDHAALALNEVGGEPAPLALSLHRFHGLMAARARHWPNALSATSTHDTKRGEDARARLYAITEAPELWAEAVSRWQKMNAQAVASPGGEPAPEPSVQWMLYQALAGVWPMETDIADADALKVLEERFIAFVEKALREAKLRSNWLDPDTEYEAAVIAYARRLLSPQNDRFLADFTRTLRPFARAGFINGLTQTVIKLTAPGVPDIYQGSEGIDLSLVDPDNRRLPDFERLERALSTATDGDAEPRHGSGRRLKQRMICVLLRLRQKDPDLFARGDYQPLKVSGAAADGVIAFARTAGAEALVVIAPRLVLQRLADASQPGLDGVLPEGDVILPPSLAHRPYHDVWTGTVMSLGDRLAIRDLPSALPFLVLHAQTAER